MDGNGRVWMNMEVYGILCSSMEQHPDLYGGLWNGMDCYGQVFLGFTGAYCSKSEWGSTQNVLMIILYRSEQISRNCTYLLPNKRSTHTVKNYFPPMTVYQFVVDPQ